MALGSKLGGILSKVGAPIAAIPGPWSALGVALIGGGMAASQVGAGKEKKEAERAQQEAENQQMQPQPAEQQDASRPEQAQLETNPQQPQPQGPNRNVFQPQPTGLGGYQSQLDASIANLILGNDLGGV
jgi:hypothetical protein